MARLCIGPIKGTKAFLFEPLELMEKLAALLPIPRAKLVRYHGILALAPTSSLTQRKSATDPLHLIFEPRPVLAPMCAALRWTGLELT
jgi:hypothetical protein